MNELDLQELSERVEFKARVKAALKHWAYHWRVTKAAELEALTPDSYRIQRKAMIAFIFAEADRATAAVAEMVIADPSIKALACYHLVTPEKIKAVTDQLLGKAVTWFVPEGYLMTARQDEEAAAQASAPNGAPPANTGQAGG